MSTRPYRDSLHRWLKVELGTDLHYVVEIGPEDVVFKSLTGTPVARVKRKDWDDTIKRFFRFAASGGSVE